MENEVIHTITGKDMQYMDIMKNQVLGPLWKRGFGNELGCLSKAYTTHR
jgi:hypothetical protein